MKLFISIFLNKAAKEVGGVNFLLTLVEELKDKKPNALILKERKVQTDRLTIQWNKTVFKDKFDLLESVVTLVKSSEIENFNLLSEENQKRKKKILNMIRTLAPLDFVVTSKEYGGFEFKVFDKTEDDYVTFNPIFLAFFFCGINYVKEAIKYSKE